MKIIFDIDELEADALATYCQKISYFDIIKKAKSNEEAQSINDALHKIENELLTKKAML